MSTVVDAHHHFWDTSRFDYYWMTDEFAAIRGQYGPDDLQPLLAVRGIDRTVLVQTIPSLSETVEFLATAATRAFIAGVVGWVDLTDPTVASILAELKGRPGGRKLVGIRHQAHDEPDPDWLRRPDVMRGIAAVQQAGLAFDLLVRARELPAAVDLVHAFPSVRFVIDHIAKPNINRHEFEPWESRIKPLASCPNVWVKLSGMIEEAGWVSWRPEDLVPYVQRLRDWFGPDRLIFGSNWPVCLVAGTYSQVYDALLQALGDITPAEKAAIFGDNAVVAYRLGVGRSG
jgi:L-fuconolactonase